MLEAPVCLREYDRIKGETRKMSETSLDDDICLTCIHLPVCRWAKRSGGCIHYKPKNPSVMKERIPIEQR